MSRVYDVVAVGDFRFPGGSSTAVAAEIRAQADAGYRAGLVQIKGPVLKFPHPIHPEIRGLIDGGLCDLLDPDRPTEARLVLAHHPQVFQNPPSRPLALESERRLLVVHHPPRDGFGQAWYDPEAVDAALAEALGGRAAWAPISPVVRAQFAPPPFGMVDRGPELFAEDWVNVVDSEPWATPDRRPPVGRPIVVGRHSRPDPLKWPESREAVLEAYPDDPRFAVDVLGHGAFLDRLMGAYPANWRLRPFDAAAPRAFLKGVDAFVFFHHPRWVEAFGRTTIEAMASGCVAVLPAYQRAVFGEAALCCERREVAEAVAALRDPALFRERSRLGAEAVRERFGPGAHVARLRRLIGPPRRTTAAPGRPASAKPSPRPRRALFVTSDGIGMGHLTRLLAVAERCRHVVEPVFITMSQAMRVVGEAGYLAEYLPYHAYLGVDRAAWNRTLEAEIAEAIAFYGPSVLVFDGNMPYGGLLRAAAGFPDLGLVWCRRAMWRPNSGLIALEREPAFDAVIEPGEIAGAADLGPTTTSRERTRRVAPIRLIDEAGALPRAAARAELGLPPNGVVVLVQLGAGNNYDYTALRERCLAHLAGRPGVTVAVTESPIGNELPDLPAGVARLRVFPLGRTLNAFDFAVGAAGYNAFHEHLLGGLPSLFVPNEHPMMDDQLARARHAERRGLGLCLQTREVYRLTERLDRLLDPGVREAMRRRMAALDPTNGAHEAARVVEELALGRRTDRATAG